MKGPVPESIKQNPMRGTVVIDDPQVEEKLLRHLDAWHDPPAHPAFPNLNTRMSPAPWP